MDAIILTQGKKKARHTADKIIPGDQGWVKIISQGGMEIEIPPDVAEEIYRASQDGRAG